MFKKHASRRADPFPRRFEVTRLSQAATRTGAAGPDIHRSAPYWLAPNPKGVSHASPFPYLPQSAWPWLGPISPDVDTAGTAALRAGCCKAQRFWPFARLSAQEPSGVNLRVGPGRD